MDSPALSCATCAAPISKEELAQGLAVRVDGRLVCPQCVDALPGETQVRINQVRAVRGFEVTTYQVAHARHPRLKAYTFTTAANQTHHRRELVHTGRFDAPLLTTGQAMPQPRALPPHRPAFPPIAIAGAAGLAVVAGIVTVLSLRSSPTPAPVPRSTIPVTAPKPVRQRVDFAADPLIAWNEAKRDPACPSELLQAIAKETTDARTAQLDAAERALGEDRLDAVEQYLAALSPPDDLAFQVVRDRATVIATRRTEAARALATPEPSPLAPAPAQPTPAPTDPVVATPVDPIPIEAPTPAPAGDRMLFPAAALILDKTKEWRVNAAGALVLADDSGSLARTVDLGGGDYQLWVQARSSEHPGSLQVSLGKRTSMPVVIKQGRSDAWYRVQPDTVTVPAGPTELKLVALGKGATILAFYLAASAHPDAPTSERSGFTADPPWNVPKPPDAVDPTLPLIAEWTPRFVNAGVVEVDRFDERTRVPGGLPGGASAVWESSNKGRKRHAVVLDLSQDRVENGGLVIIVHPVRPTDRATLLLSVIGDDDKPLALPALGPLPVQWSTQIIDLRSVELARVKALVIEDVNVLSTSFMVSKAVTVANAAPTAAMIGVRPPALLPIAARDLERVIEAAASKRRMRNWRRDFAPAQMKLLIGHQMQAGEWATSVRKELKLLFKDALGAKDLPNGTIETILLNNEWLNGMFKPVAAGAEPVIDPLKHQVVCFCTAGVEFPIGLTEPQAFINLWIKLIDVSIEHGVLPVAVLGPNKVDALDAPQVEQLWRDVEAHLRRSRPGIPMIDLRPARAISYDRFAPNMSDLAAQLFLDGYGELYQRIKALKATVR
ncbi:MAG: hypothetical protein H0W72_13680 [Planctomycetes bacterium]|nr:hypothetical protein [Planctomycetota bacterium]